VTDDWKKSIPFNVRLRVFIRDWYIKNVYNNYQVFRRKNGWADSDLFRHILIQTNYRCTRRCSFCHYGLDTPPKNVDMDDGLFYKIINQLSELRYSGRIGLMEMNEPLTDKRLPQFLRYARKQVPRAWFFITTNGDLLSERKAKSLFDDGLDYIYLNSYDQKALNLHLTLINNIDPKYRSKIYHIDRTYQTWWSSRGGNLKQFYKKAVKAPCDMVYLVMYVKPTGKVYACYNDYYDVNEMGDLNKQNLLDAWFSKSFMDLRKELNRSNRDYSPLCAQCDYIGYHSLPRIPLSRRIRWFPHR